MRRTPPLFRHTKSRSEHIIQIKNGTFYAQHPAVEGRDSVSTNPPLFRNLTFELPATAQRDAPTSRLSPHWAVIGNSGTTKFLEILRGSYICLPPGARSFPYLSSDEIAAKDHRLRIPSRAIQYVGFNSGKGQGFDSGVRGAYLSARYESRREETDWSVIQYLRGETSLNPAEEKSGKDTNDALLRQVVRDLRLEKLLHLPVSSLSNGQTRRSRIARALLGKPELLLLDEPFMGLDPPTLVSLSPILRDLAYKSSPMLLLALRPQDPVPDWITHLVILGKNNSIALIGKKAQVLFSLHRWADMYNSKSAQALAVKMATKMTEAYGPPLLEVGHTLTSGGVVRYTTYENAKNARRPNHSFNTYGDVYTVRLSPEQREQMSDTLGKPREEWTLDDWVMVTSTLPTEPKRQKRLTKIAESSETNASGEDPESSGLDLEAYTRPLGEPLIELGSVVVKYGDKTVLGHPPPQPGFAEPGLNLTIYRGTRLALLGPNGSGKTTLLSLLTSDHPHSYSLPIRFFGRSRLPQRGQPGLSLWEIQSRIGHSSPEVHSFFPKGLTIRKVLESAWAETFGAKPTLTWERDEMVDAFLRWWEPELRQIWPGITRPEMTEAARRERRTWVDYLPKDLDEAERQKIVRGANKPPGYTKNPIWEMMQQSYPPFIQASRLSIPAEVPDDYSLNLYNDAEEPDDARESSEYISSLPPELDTSLDWAEDVRNHTFSLLPFGAQRLLLLLRALIKEPDILVLDEAFSGLSPEVRDKAMCWLEHGEEIYLQGQMVGSSPAVEATSQAEDDSNDGEEEPSEVGDSSVLASKRVGRPRKVDDPLPRPLAQPGRKPGRPKGAKTRQGPSLWTTRTRQEVDLTGEERWEVVKAPNMRYTVERICRVFDLDIGQLAQGRWMDCQYKAVHKCTWNELLDIAEGGSLPDIQLSKESGVESVHAKRTETKGPVDYKFKGLNDQQAMAVVSHVREEVPSIVDEWLRLPGEEEVVELGRGVEMGRCDGGSIRTVEGWAKVWGLQA